MNILPLRNLVLVELDPPEQRGPILLPELARVPPNTGVVRAVGPGESCPDGTRRRVAVTVGERVMVSEHVGELVPASLLQEGARAHLLIADTFLLGVVESPAN